MTKRVVHVDVSALQANIADEAWTRPTLMIADPDVPFKCVRVHAVEVVGVVRFVERPPGVHACVDDAALLTAYDADGRPVDLPEWAKGPSQSWVGNLPDVVLQSCKRMREVISGLTRQHDALLVVVPRMLGKDASRVRNVINSLHLAIGQFAKQRMLLAIAAGGSAEDTKPGTGEWRVAVDKRGG